MALEDCLGEMANCTRCSLCKYIPMARVKGVERSVVCPSITKYEFHTFSAGGRMAMGAGLLKNKMGYTPKLLEAIYNCQMCGACDVSCKYGMDMEVIEPLYELRIKAVSDGQTNKYLEGAVNNLRQQNSLVIGAKTRRSDWAEGLKVKNLAKEKAQVIYFTGCRTSADQDLWPVARANVNILQNAGVDLGIWGAAEICCGGRAYSMGYQSDFLRQAEKNIKLIQQSGAKTLVTGCAECYQAFKVLYDKFNLKGDLEVLHTTEYFARLIQVGQLKLNRKVATKVTYHDPCHLGRLGEPWIHWQGKPIRGHIRLFDPPKVLRRGDKGIYEPPRQVLQSIPNLKLVEMDRIREYAWCCGSGGGVKESNPEFAQWTAAERIKEAALTGAEMIVTACPGCRQNFKEVLKANGNQLTVCDITELLEKAI
jgi:Fe-S oxidoreductase